MSVLLFKLNSVPEDEANDVRALLRQNGIDFYETSAGILGFSLAAIWLRDETKLESARALIDSYQRDRGMRVRAEYEKLMKEGKAETIVDRIRHDPLRFLFYVAAILFILYFSIKPFLDLGR